MKSYVLGLQQGYGDTKNQLDSEWSASKQAPPCRILQTQNFGRIPACMSLPLTPGAMYWILC